MNIQTVIVLIIIFVLAGIAVYSAIKNRHGSSCCGDCRNCKSNCKK